jgi:RNA polymerase sigma factor for flagellar operon FliA
MSRTARENPSVRKQVKAAASASPARSTAGPAKSIAPSAALPASRAGRSAASAAPSATAVAEFPSDAAAKRPTTKSRTAKPAAAIPAATESRASAKPSRTRSAAAVDVTSVAVAAEMPSVKIPSAKIPSAKVPSAKPLRSVTKATASGAAAARAAKAPAKPLSLAERPIDQIWREYRVSPTEEVRNFLIGRHLDLVAYAAERLHKRLPSEVEINDLKSAGAFGLMDAVESFDPDRGVKFETYCTQRIRGAMFDELRSMDWVPRLVRSRTAKVEKVRKSIEMETGARPTEDEVAARLNVSGDEFEKLQKDSRPISMVSLTRKCFETDSSKDVREIDVVEDGRQENPLQAVQKQDLQALITKGLSRAERLIVILYYYEEMTMKEIGATLDLSESRVSQMHSSILARLKAQMQHRENTEE